MLGCRFATLKAICVLSWESIGRCDKAQKHLQHYLSSVCHCIARAIRMTGMICSMPQVNISVLRSEAHTCNCRPKQTLLVCRSAAQSTQKAASDTAKLGRSGERRPLAMSRFTSRTLHIFCIHVTAVPASILAMYSQGSMIKLALVDWYLFLQLCS